MVKSQITAILFKLLSFLSTLLVHVLNLCHSSLLKMNPLSVDGHRGILIENKTYQSLSVSKYNSPPFQKG
jgi:hypothetical protein